ncbi:citrate synthase (unknown stereospecificity) OS=Castellaniella defragrans OX=75697 GN=HNR28_003407 PE=3 SV=1 [Castellaniella defragrans]
MKMEDSAQLLSRAKAWWTTKIVDIRPGVIRIKGRPIQDLIGNVGYAHMVWTMLRDDSPTQAQLSLFEAALVAAVDHGPQAPSIAVARMGVTCGLPLNGAMASAVNVLDDIHGGAGEQCLALYNAILEGQAGMPAPGQLDARLRAYVEKSGSHIPGFGHRFHPVDPRAVKLLSLVERARLEGVVSGRHAAVGKAIEAWIENRAGRRIPMNIDGATAAVYGELGFEPELARGLFVLSRSVGILAHAWEQKKQGGRIKGPMPPDIAYTYIGQ